jgi:O-methyltransferase involved in polyketide biosynthesis
MILRARQLDQWTTEYLNNHSGEPIQVLHLACGLDARSHRITWGRNVRWINVDLPEVVDLRRKLLPEPEGDYTLLAGSVLDDDFIDTIPNDRPTLIVFEGLIMYLDPPDAERMVTRLCARFGTAAPGRNQLLFDVLGPALAAMQKWTAVFKAALWLQSAGADWKYAVDEPVVLERLYPGLKLVTGILCTEHNASIKELPSRYQWGCWLMAKLPGLRYATMWLRYSF